MPVFKFEIIKPVEIHANSLGDALDQIELYYLSGEEESGLKARLLEEKEKDPWGGSWDGVYEPGEEAS
jgi:hypothetical protein